MMKNNKDLKTLIQAKTTSSFYVIFPTLLIKFGLTMKLYSSCSSALSHQLNEYLLYAFLLIILTQKIPSQQCCAKRRFHLLRKMRILNSKKHRGSLSLSDSRSRQVMRDIYIVCHNS